MDMSCCTQLAVSRWRWTDPSTTTVPSCGDAMGCLSLVLQVVAASWWNLSPFGILLRLMYQQEAGVGHALSMQVGRCCCCWPPALYIIAHFDQPI